MPRRSRSLPVLVLSVLALLLGTAAPAHAYPPDPPSVSTTYDQLAALTVAAPGSMTGYSRDRFPHWSSQGDSCSTREVVLQRDGSGVTVGSDCYPTSGDWYSVYDQVWVSEPSDVDIDHMVPLAEAWRSGADDWSDSTREAFANDLSRGQLIAASASSNRTKGDQPPNEWRPSNTGWWCYYAQHWTDVKYDWDLTATSAEKDALYDMLGTC